MKSQVFPATACLTFHPKRIGHQSACSGGLFPSHTLGEISTHPIAYYAFCSKGYSWSVKQSVK
jgi:hypothetical protein